MSTQTAGSRPRQENCSEMFLVLMNLVSQFTRANKYKPATDLMYAYPHVRLDEEKLRQPEFHLISFHGSFEVSDLKGLRIFFHETIVLFKMPNTAGSALVCIDIFSPKSKQLEHVTADQKVPSSSFGHCSMINIQELFRVAIGSPQTVIEHLVARVIRKKIKSTGNFLSNVSATFDKKIIKQEELQSLLSKAYQTIDQKN